MKKHFNYKNFMVNCAVLILFLATFILIHLETDPNNIFPTMGYYFSLILFMLMGVFFNQSKFVSLFQKGQLIIRVDYLILAIVFFLLLFLFFPIPAFKFRITVLVELLRALHLGYDLLEPILLFAPKLIPLFFGYFAAGVFYKVKE